MPISLKNVLLFACLLTAVRLMGQDFNFADDLKTTRIKRLAVNASDTLWLDSLSIQKQSFQIKDVDSSAYRLFALDAFLVWVNKPPLDSVELRYKVFAFPLTKSFSHKSYQQLSQVMVSSDRLQLGSASTGAGLVDFGAIDYNGGFSRAISFGNNQDAVLNSNFNLQLNGYLPDSIKILASVTDNTIPFQPEGNTARVQEFDKIFIQLQRKQAKLTLGDHELFRPQTHFINYYKRVQGALFSSQLKGKDSLHYYKFEAGASLAKGKFTRNTFQGQEANQGPYKLSGPNQETFLIILANSERVTLDGIQMQRGEDYDYVIDYNTAEITFMPKRMISKDSRIIVEFEFNDRNYLNTLLVSNHEWSKGTKLKMHFNFFSNQDAKNQSFLQQLDTAQKRYLSNIGDNLALTAYPSARPLDSAGVGIAYVLIDTLVDATLFDSVYRYSPDSNATRYLLNFSFVGQGKGNYIQSLSSANGRVYQWVAPQNGVPQGAYEPVQILVPPKRQQLLEYGVVYRFSDNNILKANAALSNSDPNLFSTIDNQQHLGTALHLSHQLQQKVTAAVNLVNSFKAEYVHAQFRPIDRFRSAEFNRDWTVLDPLHFYTEKFVENDLQFLIKTSTKFQYQVAAYQRGANYNALRQMASGIYNHNGFVLTAVFNQTRADYDTMQSNFSRPAITLEKTLSKFKQLKLGTKCSLEHNFVRNLQQDFLPQTFAFDVLSIYAESGASSVNKYAFRYFARQDHMPHLGLLKKQSLSHNFQLQTDLFSLPKQNLSLQITYRSLTVFDTAITSLRPEDALLSRLSYDAKLYKGLIQWRTLLDIGSGQELKREFTYVEVPVGQGTHVWRDYDQDGLQQLNEFELALFPDEKKFIKIFTPSTTYVKAKYTQLNQSLIINPHSIFSGAQKRFQKILSQCYWQTTMQLNSRFIASGGLQQYNPFYSDDANVLSANNLISHNFSYNKYSSDWNLDLLYNTNSAKILLNYGVDTRNQRELIVKNNINYSRNFSTSIEYHRGQRSFRSLFLDGRNYNFDFTQLSPTARFLTTRRKFSVELGYKYDQRINQLVLGGEQAYVHSATALLQYNSSGSVNVNARFTYSKVNYNATVNSSIAYVMLDALQLGQNYLWKLSFDKRLSKTFELNLEYEGRKPGLNAVVHTGRANARVIF